MHRDSTHVLTWYGRPFSSKVALNETAQEECFMLDICTLNWRKTRNIQKKLVLSMSEMMLKHFASFLDLCTSQARKLLKHKAIGEMIIFLPRFPVYSYRKKNTKQNKETSLKVICVCLFLVTLHLFIDLIYTLTLLWRSHRYDLNSVDRWRVTERCSWPVATSVKLGIGDS